MKRLEGITRPALRPQPPAFSRNDPECTALPPGAPERAAIRRSLSGRENWMSWRVREYSLETGTVTYGQLRDHASRAAGMDKTTRKLPLVSTQFTLCTNGRQQHGIFSLDVQVAR